MQIYALKAYQQENKLKKVKQVLLTKTSRYL